MPPAAGPWAAWGEHSLTETCQALDSCGILNCQIQGIELGQDLSLSHKYFYSCQEEMGARQHVLTHGTRMMALGFHVTHEQWAGMTRTVHELYRHWLTLDFQSQESTLILSPLSKSAHHNTGVLYRAGLLFCWKCQGYGLLLQQTREPSSTTDAG